MPARSVLGPTEVGRLGGEAIAGQGWQYEVERVRRSPPCAVGSVNGPTVFEQLDDRAGPAVRHDQRQRVRVRRLHVDEVDVQPHRSRSLNCGSAFSFASALRQS